MNLYTIAFTFQNTLPKGLEIGDANFKEFTWNILITKKNSNSKLCGGTLIAPNVVLTSASCVQFEKPDEILLKAGGWKLEADSDPLHVQTSRAKSIILHPSFKSENHDNDLAIIVTNSDFQYGGLNDHISPICIDDGNLTEKEHCVVIGWGEEAFESSPLMFFIVFCFIDS